MSRNMGKYSATNYQASKLSVYPILPTLQSSIGSQISRKTGLSISKFLRGKRKKIPGFFFFADGEASWIKECFDRKKSPTILKVSMKLSAILSTDYDQFGSLVGQRKKRKFVNSIMNFSNIRLSLWRRCCLTKGEDAEAFTPERWLRNKDASLKLSLLFHLDSEHVCASVDVLPS